MVDTNRMKILTPKIGWKLFASIMVMASACPEIQAQSPRGRMTLTTPATLTMQTPIGEAHMELPSGTVIENAAIINGGVQIENGPFSGWVPVENTNLSDLSGNKEENSLPVPLPTAQPAPENLQPLQQDYPLFTISVLLGIAILIIIAQMRSVQKWFSRTLQRINSINR